MSMEEGGSPLYKYVPLWVREYGMSGATDQQAVGTFIDCETREAVTGLQNELIAIAKGRYKNEVFDLLVGINRRVKYTSYQDWAKLMLQWIAAHKG
jgi:hypothetical protein